MRLSPQTLAHLSPGVARPGYDRAAQAVGIVHLGLGAFHRTHQAVYTDDAMAAGDRDWAIIGVSLRSDAVQQQLRPQAGLYTVTERDGLTETRRLIGSLRDVLVASRDPTGVIEALAAASTYLVTLTVTEKAYCRDQDGSLDLAAPDLAHDLPADRPPRTIFGFLARGLALRRGRGLAGLTLVCCDNLPENGAVLQSLLARFLEVVDPALAAWVANECTFPSTMVDRIAPASTALDLHELARNIGVADEAAVFTEPFCQWVIEDRFVGPRPRWEVGGAQMVSDVHAYETAKLRMLNGAHSALAYIGLQAGHTYVHQAVRDPAIRPIIETLVRDEAASSLSPASGQNLTRYADALLVRFENQALAHRLSQIAMDGSQKIPQRWLATLAIRQARDQASPALMAAIAAWLLHVRGDGAPVSDPAAGQLADLWRRAGLEGIVRATFGPDGLFASHWIVGEAEARTLTALMSPT